MYYIISIRQASGIDFQRYMSAYNGIKHTESIFLPFLLLIMADIIFPAAFYFQDI